MVPRLLRLAKCRFLLPFAIFLFFGGLGTPALAQVNLYEQTLNVVSFGGSYTRSQMLAYVRPWEAATGKFVNMIDYGGGLTEIRSQVSSVNVKWDVVDMEFSDLIAACRDGLLETADVSLIADGDDGTPANEDIPEKYLHECGYPSVVWSTVFAYSNLAFPDDKPSTVADFFDVTKYPGKRGLRRDPRGLLEWALMAEGVAPSDVYSVLSTPQGVAYAFETASVLKPHIVWWSSGREPVNMLSNGTVTMTAAWNGRLFGPIVEENMPISIVWDGQMVEVEYWAIPKGSPRLDNARSFIQFALQTKNMASQSNYISYGPVRKSSQALISDTVKPYLPTSNLDNSVRVDSHWWAKNMAHLSVIFEEWLKPNPSEIDRAVRF